MTHSPVDADLIRLVHLLMHDLRAPLGVAHGYLRLLRDQRLTSDADRDKALTAAVEALGRITRICADATVLVQTFETPPSAGTPVPAGRLAAQVSQALAGRLVSSLSPIPEGSAVRIGSVDVVAGAMAALAITVAGPTPRADCSVAIEAGEHELRVLLGSEEERRRLVEGPRLVLDPWRGYGLALPTACRTVERNGGVVWVVEGQRGTVGVALPLEVSS